MARLAKRSDRRRSLPRLGALPPRYSFVLNPDTRAKFTKCPRCNAQTRLRKLALLVHVEHPAGARLAILGKTCRLCVECEMLIAHEADISQLLVAVGLAADGGTPSYVVLGTVAPPVWRASLTRGVTLDAVRAYAADFKQYMRIDITPGGWDRDEEIADGDVANTGAASPRRPRRRIVRTSKTRHILDRADDTIRWHALGARCAQARGARGIRDVAIALGIPQYRLRAIEGGRFTEFRIDLARRYFRFLAIEEWVKRWCRSNRELATRVGVIESRAP